MSNLLAILKEVVSKGADLPFSVYSSANEQRLLNVPIAKPLLVVVMSGQKQLGKNHKILCHSGQFVFLSDSPAIDMRNIPGNKEYFALLIEFDYKDFRNIANTDVQKSDYFTGEVSHTLEQCLLQFIECTRWASEDILSLRKQEILLLLYQLGYTQIVSMMTSPKVSYQLHNLFYKKKFQDITTDYICEYLAMSESTLRRRLKLEGSSVQEIKDRARLGYGLHLLQTTNEPIGLIAENCGYHSQSRFSDRFKGLFGMSPSELRKTKLTD